MGEHATILHSWHTHRCYLDLKYAPRKLVSPKLGPQQTVLLGEVRETVEAIGRLEKMGHRGRVLQCMDTSCDAFVTGSHCHHELNCDVAPSPRQTGTL